MSLRSLLGMVSTRVAGIDPRTDDGAPFTPWESASGSPGARLDDCEAPGRSRYFDVKVTSAPEDDGAAYATSPRLRASFAVRVLYARGYGEDSEAIDRTIAEDVASILARVLDPNGWAATTHLVDTIDPAGPAATSRTSDAAVLVSIPFTAIFYES